jgi:hypothetical protein
MTTSRVRSFGGSIASPGEKEIIVTQREAVFADVVDVTTFHTDP